MDPNDGLREIASLWLAESVDELHRVLVLHPPVRRTADATEPVALLEKFRATEPDTTVQTALLLLTDRRWKNACGQVVRGIESRGLLDDEQLDLLARTFLTADDAVHWTVPDEWFDGGLEIVLEDWSDLDPDNIETDDADTDGVPEAGPAVARREVHPPLRRWAAERVVRRDPFSWPGVTARSDELGGRRGAYVALGLLDALDVLPDATQGLLVEKAVRASDQAVRLAGFERLALRAGASIAIARAKHDPSAKVRAWAAKAASGSVSSGTDAGGEQHSSGEQSSLF